MSVRRGIREENFRKILLTKFLPNDEQNSIFSMKELKGSVVEKTFLETYKALGGRDVFPESTFTAPFTEFGKFSVIFDDAIRFNRYRAKTLRSPFYESTTSFPLMKYRSYCRKYETECLKSGTSDSEWTNSEAERYFGRGEAPGDLGLSGSPGWKLRALTDFAADLIARQRKIRLLRIAVWDDIFINQKLVKFKDLLISPGKQETELILKFTERKVFGLYADDF